MNQNRADDTDETDESPKESSFVSFGSTRSLLSFLWVVTVGADTFGRGDIFVPR